MTFGLGRVFSWTPKAWSRKKKWIEIWTSSKLEILCFKKYHQKSEKPQVKRKYFQIMYLIMVSVPLYTLYFKNFCNLIVR